MYETLLQSSPSGQIYWAFFLEALATTALVSIFAAVFATLLALVLSVLSHQGKRTAKYSIELFRNVPLIVQVFACYYIVPTLITPLLKLSNASQVLVLGTTALILYMGARMASQLLSALQAIPKGQLEACKSLGLSTREAYRRVLAPIAFRTALPSLTNEWAATVKNSSVISTIGLFELSKSSQIFIEYTSQAYLAFGITVCGYIALNSLLIAGARALDTRIRIRGHL